MSGALKESVILTFHALGDESVADIMATLNVSTVAPGPLVCTSGNASQSVVEGEYIIPIIYELGGDAHSFAYSQSCESGLTYSVNGNILTISGAPAATVTYKVSALGGMNEINCSGTITVMQRTHTLGATDDSGWYQIHTTINDLPVDLAGHVSLNFDNADSYGSQ